MTDTPSLPPSRRLPQKAQPEAAPPLTAGPPSVAETLKRLRRHKSLSLEELAQMYYYALTVLGREPDVVPVEELNNWSYPKEIN